MTTDPILTAAQWGFAVFHKHRPSQSWDRAGNAVHIRWELVAAKVLAGDITADWMLRKAYLDGYYAMEWHELSREDKRRWADVLAAMQAAGAMEQAA